MSRALVVGGNGFIGAHLVQKLVDTGWDVTILHKYEQPRYSKMPTAVRFLRGDLTQESLLAEAVQNQDVVFHLLWTTTAIHEVANRDPAADVQANLVPTIHLVEACLAAGVGRLVFTSSGGTVYGRTQTAPIPEDHPNNPVNAYGVSKLAVEKYLQNYPAEKGKPEICNYCFHMILDKTAAYAKKLKIPYIATTWCADPGINQKLLKQVGEAVAEAHGIRFYYQPYYQNKKEVYAASDELKLYRQNWCGCLLTEVEYSQKQKK